MSEDVFNRGTGALARDSEDHGRGAHATNRMQWWLVGELLGLFFLLPLVIWWMDWPGVMLMPALGIVMAGAAVIAWRNRATADALGMGERGRRKFRACLAIGMVLWAGIVIPVILVQWRMGHEVLPMVAHRPGLFAMLALIYPLSVLAQEFLFRGFFFWRYARVLGEESLLWINVAAFGWMHIVYGSWVSVALTVLAGTLLTVLYLHYRTLWGIMVIHGLLGLSLFAGGFGKYFFKEMDHNETRMVDRGGSGAGADHHGTAGSLLAAGADRPMREGS